MRDDPAADCNMRQGVAVIEQRPSADDRDRIDADPDSNGATKPPLRSKTRLRWT